MMCYFLSIKPTLIEFRNRDAFKDIFVDGGF